MHAPAWILLAAALLAWTSSEAQIFECAGKDGSRVFSDKRCGPDARVVQPTVKPKRPPPTATSPKATSPKPVKSRKPADELEQLALQCNGGDMKACTDWTMGGGPELLRDQERRAEQECEAGSLAACEERYCREGIDADCRARVQRTARLAGDTWYLRDETRDSAPVSPSISCVASRKARASPAMSWSRARAKQVRIAAISAIRNTAFRASRRPPQINARGAPRPRRPTDGHAKRAGSRRRGTSAFKRLQRWWPKPAVRKRWMRTIASAPATVQFAVLGAVLVALWFGINWIYQVVRKPSELFFPVSGVLYKLPEETWTPTSPRSARHSTGTITPEFLAALAQIEASGNPVARTYWRWSMTPRASMFTGPRRARSACISLLTVHSRRRGVTAFTITPSSRMDRGTMCTRAGSTRCIRG